MKTVDKIPRNERPAIYAVLYPILRTIALDNGYSLAIHGSVINDVDLLAVPWVENVISPDELIHKFWEAVGSSVWKINDDSILKAEERPHNRLSYLIPIMGKVRIDVSIVKPIEQIKEVCDWEYSKDGTYRTSCDEGIGVVISSLYINLFRYCPCCGNSIKIKGE